MSHAPTIFQHESFLSATLARAGTTYPRHLSLNSGLQVTLLDEGIVQFVPAVTEQLNKDERVNLKGLILSAGVHGNETAPIELLDKLVDDCLSEVIEVQRPTLIILAHPQAMRLGQRFVDFNMNRLFMGEHREPEFQGSVDALRADSLERHVKNFAKLHAPNLHLDLHTAIRDSEIERFALKPFTSEEQSAQNSLSKETETLLASMGVTALVYQHKRSTTFSSFSALTFGCESYTLELGKVRAFGDNKLEHYADTYAALKSLLESGTAAEALAFNTLTEYKVCAELIRDADRFELNIEESTPNFRGFENGTWVYRSQISEYCVQSPMEYLIFPNTNVPLGQRVGLMLKRIDRG